MAWFEHGTSLIYHEAQGSGTPVLVLPGLFGSIEEFSGLRDALVPAARSRSRVRTLPPTMRKIHMPLRPCSSTWRADRRT